MKKEFSPQMGQMKSGAEKLAQLACISGLSLASIGANPEKSLACGDAGPLASLIFGLKGELACTISDMTVEEGKQIFTNTEQNSRFLGNPLQSRATCLEQFQRLVNAGVSRRYSNISSDIRDVKNPQINTFNCFGFDNNLRASQVTGSKTRSCQLTYGINNSRISFQTSNPANGENKPGCYQTIMRVAQ